MMFLDALVAMRAVSANTLAAYRRDLADTSQLLHAGKTSLSDCNADDLRRVISLWHQRGLSARSVARRLSALRQFMGWAVDDQIRTDNPCRWIDNPSLPTPCQKA
jgi:integrase/recombinase XerD